jgi:hypothetical protein
MISASFDLVAKIVREGLTYANLLGFEPHPDYHDAALLLEGAVGVGALESVLEGLGDEGWEADVP